MHDLAELAVIWAAVFLASWLAKISRLTPVLWFLFFGALLVNTGVLPEEPSAFIRSFSEFGIIAIMFALGFEENAASFFKGIRRSWGIALFGAMAPFIAAYSVSYFFWHNSAMSLLIGLAMSSTAVSLTMVSLKSEGLHKSKIANGIMTSAVLDNITSLALVAIVVPLATGQTEATVTGIGLMLLKAILYFIVISFFGFVIFPNRALFSWLKHIPLVRWFGLVDVLALEGGRKATLTLLLLALLSGLLSHLLGIHPAVGAYMAGLVLQEEYFNFKSDLDGDHYVATRRIIDDIAFSWIGPVFFVVLGTKLVFHWDIFVAVALDAALLTLALMICQVGAAGLAARYTGRFTTPESWMIGLGMLGRAELAFVVMDIGYVQYPLFTTEAFYTLMFTAFWLNISVPLGIRLYRPYYDKHEPAFADH